jgi:hypothetical protein
MKTSQFIERKVQAIENGETMSKKYCASVMVDGNTIYSYGYHYPLLFRIEDKNGRMVWVCNNGGYSATTRKHISWAGGFADIFASIGGTGGFFSHTVDRNMVIDALRKELNETMDAMDAKKRKDTATYRMLEQQHARVWGFLHRLV